MNFDMTLPPPPVATATPPPPENVRASRAGFLYKQRVGRLSVSIAHRAVDGLMTMKLALTRAQIRSGMGREGGTSLRDCELACLISGLYLGLPGTF